MKKNLTKTELSAADKKADRAVNIMMTTVAGTALWPAHVNWALTAGAMATGCVAIGRAYGFHLDKEDGWALCKQFILGAGFWFVSMNIGTKFLAALAESTCIGYLGGAALDIGISCASAWAIGGCAKAYFRKMATTGDVVTKAELQEIFKGRFSDYRNRMGVAA